MKKSESQKFEDFKKRYNLTDSHIIRIIMDYAHTVPEYSAGFFANKYNISTHVFYKLRDYSIIFMLVSGTVCCRIRDKAFLNQGLNNPSGSNNHFSSEQHYKKLIRKRKEYLSSFSNEQIIKIATSYANGEILNDIAKSHNISIYTTQKLLAIALINRLVSEDCYLNIKARSDYLVHHLFRNYSGYTAEELWNFYSH